MMWQKVRMLDGNADVIIEVLLKFTEPYIAIGETNHDEIAYNNLLEICYIHDYCYDLIRENAELKGNEYSVVKAREKAIKASVPDGKMFVSVTGQTITETLYGMSEVEFIKLAKVLPPRTAKETE